MLTEAPKSLKIAKLLEKEIISQKLKAGDKLYSVRYLSSQHSVSSQVINSAFTILENKNLIKRVHGSGTYVLETDGKDLTKEKVWGFLSDFSAVSYPEYFKELNHFFDRRGAVFSPLFLKRDQLPNKQLDMLKNIGSDMLILDIDGTLTNLSTIDSLRESFKLGFAHRWFWNDKITGPAVLTDFKKILLDALTFFLSNGHENVAILHFGTKPTSFLQAAIDDAAKHLGFEIPSSRVTLINLYDYKDNPDEIISLFKRKKPTTGIFAQSDFLAYKFIASLKKHIPNLDVELIGCFDTVWSKLPDSEFHSFKMNFREIFKRLLEKIDQNDETVDWVKPDFIKRNSLMSKKR